MVLELASQKTMMNEEVLSPAELEKRLVVYAESARLTKSRPVLNGAALRPFFDGKRGEKPGEKSELECETNYPFSTGNFSRTIGP